MIVHIFYSIFQPLEQKISTPTMLMLIQSYIFSTPIPLMLNNPHFLALPPHFRQNPPQRPYIRLLIKKHAKITNVTINTTVIAFTEPSDCARSSIIGPNAITALYK